MTAEDPRLQEENLKQEPLTRPPGVANLRQWGEKVLLDGKHKGKNFAMVWEQDKRYVAWTKTNTNLRAANMLSFQAYVRTRQQCESEMSINQLRTASPWYPETWELVATQGASAQSSDSLLNMPPPGLPETMGHQKRSSPPTETVRMPVELAAEQKLEKLTRIALLKEEIARLSADIDK